jgi:predicted RNA-binding protein YlqC (UPF0109 family)
MGEVPDREGADEELEAEPDEDVDDDDADADDGGDSGFVDEDDDGDDLPPLEREALTEVLVFLAKGLVDEPDAVRVEAVDREGGITLRLSVDQPDMGKVIGRSGRTARALRTLMRAAGVRAGVHTHVEIVEQDQMGGSGG